MALLEERRKKFIAEGLFDEARKQLLPYLPIVIGVITSPTGAVIRDILHRLADRFPRHVLVWPVKVQGEGSAAEVAAAIEGFNGFCRSGGATAAARSAHRRPRRRLAGGFVVVQRGDRGARRRGKHDPADLRGRPRDRRDLDRFRRRPPRADADGGRRDGGAGARRPSGRYRFAGAARARLLAAQSGGAAQRTALGGPRAARRRRSPGVAAAAARSCRRGARPRAARQCANPSRQLSRGSAAA